MTFPSTGLFFLTNPASVQLDRAVYSQLGQRVLLEEETPAADCPELRREGGSSFSAGEGSGVCSIPLFSLQQVSGKECSYRVTVAACLPQLDF